MCGRYAVTSAPAVLRALFGYAEQPNFPPRYNIAPTQPIAVVRPLDRKRQVALVRWAAAVLGQGPEELHATDQCARRERRRQAGLPRRHETAALSDPGRRLLYEWQATGGRKRPFYVQAKSGEPLALAGLWETWMGANGEELDTAAIVTMRANKLIESIHDRMPLIIVPWAFELWLNSNEVDPETAAMLIKPAPEDLLEAYEIAPAGQPRRQR